MMSVKYLSASVLVLGLILISCGDAPPDMPESVPNVGTMVISGYIQAAPDSTVYPDSIGIVLDDDSLGFQSNPYTLNDMLVGSYYVGVYYYQSGETLSGRSRSVEVRFAETTDAQIRMAAGGVVVVSADYEDESRDSLGVRIDGIDLGVDATPRIISNIGEGIHKVAAYWTEDTTKLEAWQADLQVVPAETTEVDMTLQVVNPFVGSHAPNIDCIDFEGNEYSLMEHWGEVIYLYFFEST